MVVKEGKFERVESCRFVEDGGVVPEEFAFADDNLSDEVPF